MNGECVVTIDAHADTVQNLMVYNGELYSASDDKTIKQWTLDGSLKAVYKGHADGVTCVSIWRGALFTAGYDKMMIQWTSKYYHQY